MAEGTITERQIHENLMSTIQFKHRKELDDYLFSCISTAEIAIPTLGYVFQKLSPEYKQEMIRLYNGTFGLYEGVNEIPDDIKAAQGAVLDGFCYYYDTVKNSLCGICTLNFKMLNFDPILDAKILDKAFKANQVGNISSHRVDFTYAYYDSNTVDFKTVAHKTVIDEENVMLIPYSAGFELSTILSNFLQQGNILAMKQTLANGSVKVRCVTNNPKHLANYCDSQLACLGLSTEFYPLQAFMYAPVLGAPSTTAMKTRVDFFNLDGIVKVSSYEQCRKLGVQKCQDPVREVFKEQAILSTLAQMKVSDPDGFLRVLNKLPDIGVLGDTLDGNVGVTTLSNYLHTATRGTVNKVLKIVPGAMEAYEARESLLVGEEKPVDVRGENLKAILKKHVVKVVWKTPKGMYSSSICTNNSDILTKIYGKGYFGRYESYGVRISFAADDVIYANMPLKEAMKIYGFDISKADEIQELYKKTGNLEEAFYQALGKKRRNLVKSDDIVTARTLSGYLSNKDSEGSTATKAEDYYVSIDTKHLVRAEIIG